MKESLDYQKYRTMCVLPATCCKTWEEELKQELKTELDDDTTPGVRIWGKKYKVDDTWTLDLNYKENQFDGKIHRTEWVKGLKSLKQLRVLLMSGQGITYIGDLPIMANLEKLDLSCNALRGIEILAEFTKLKELDLRDNKIMDLSPLEHLVNLEGLWIDDNIRQNESYWLDVLLKLPSLKRLGMKKDGEDIVYEGIDTIKNMLLQRKELCFQNIKKPVIERNGSIKKEHSVTWTLIRFGTYPNWTNEKFVEDIKDEKWKENKHYVIDKNGDYFWWGDYSDKRMGRKYRKVNSEYFFWGDIFWRVLDIKDGIALLMADDILDVKPFFTTEEKNGFVSWENCELRRWLNDENGNSFYDCAFSEDEKDALVKRGDKVCLLTMDDIESHPEYGLLELYKNGKIYMDKNNYGNKDYVDQKGLKRYVFSDNLAGAWWLGDLPKDETKAIYVDEYGKVVKKGIDADTIGIGIRPVIEVDLYKVKNSLQVDTRTVKISTMMSLVMQ